MAAKHGSGSLWFAIGALLALVAAGIFVILGLTSLLEPVTAISNSIGLAVTSVILTILKACSWKTRND